MLSVIVIFMGATSCSKKIIFTSELRAKLEQQDISLKDVQFYNSEKITLKRTDEKPEQVLLNDGEVEVKNEKYIEEIVIKKKTPAICTQVNQYHLHISFEDDANYYLKFGRKAGPILNDRYKLYAKQWNEEHGRIHYGDTLYTTGKNAADAHLLVKKNQVYDLIREKEWPKAAASRMISGWLFLLLPMH
ncbi:MAG: hypothetical protein U5L09_17205 [Bacteroidales bacterium]|nr:hypothetical protein [Bacteroidales bacterium]